MNVLRICVLGGNLTRMRRAPVHLPIYLKLAQSLEQQIQKGTFSVGDQVPSVRELSRQHRVSVSTVLQAYFWLENKGWIEAKAKSGFYVTAFHRNLSPVPASRPLPGKPRPVPSSESSLDLMQTSHGPIKVSLGAA